MGVVYVIGVDIDSVVILLVEYNVFLNNFKFDIL